MGIKKASADDFDTKKLDEKFEKMSRKCANSMTGTGSNMKRPKKTATVKKKTPAKKK